MALIRMCVVPNYSQQLSRLILWIMTVCATHWTHSTAVQVLIEGLTCLRLFTLPHHPPQPHSHPPTPDITVTVKKLLIIQQC